MWTKYVDWKRLYTYTYIYTGYNTGNLKNRLLSTLPVNNSFYFPSEERQYFLMYLRILCIRQRINITNPL